LIFLEALTALPKDSYTVLLVLIEQGLLPELSMSALTSPLNGGAGKAQDSLLDPAKFPQSLSSEDGSIKVSLTYDHISSSDVLAFIRSPNAGANVLFLGTTRNSFDNRPVSKLSYSAYPALALRSFIRIAEAVKEKHGLEKVCLMHRLGEVGIEQESIAVAVSAGHRKPAWNGAEEALEKCKARVEIWKMESFADVEDGDGQWRANCDTDGQGRKVKQ
jgi:molybdopterin synthase catalytic subunit